MKYSVYVLESNEGYAANNRGLTTNHIKYANMYDTYGQASLMASVLSNDDARWVVRTVIIEYEIVR